MAGTGSGALALSSDSEQPINVEADRATLDDSRGVMTYEGSVIVTQGTIRILADRLDLHYDPQRALEKAVASGNPARYRQLPDGSQEYVNARSKTMEYFASKNLLYLIDNARVVQGPDTITGSRITYDTIRHRAVAQAAKGGKQRVTVTVHPKKPRPEAAAPAP